MFEITVLWFCVGFVWAHGTVAVNWINDLVYVTYRLSG